MKQEACLFTCDICGKVEPSFEKRVSGPGYHDPKDWQSGLWCLGIQEICPDCYRKLLCYIQEQKQLGGKHEN